MFWFRTGGRNVRVLAEVGDATGGPPKRTSEAELGDMSGTKRKGRDHPRPKVFISALVFIFIPFSSTARYVTSSFGAGLRHHEQEWTE
jgi:hypothetical protein